MFHVGYVGPVLIHFPPNCALPETVVPFSFVLSKVIVIHIQVKGRDRQPAQLFQTH